MVWGWLCVCLVTLAVAYSMAEMCSAYEGLSRISCGMLTIQDTPLLADSIVGLLSWLRLAGLDR